MIAHRSFGFTTADGRRGGVCWDELPRCVYPHRLKQKDRKPIIDEGLTTCIHRDGPQAPRCNALLYIAQFSVGGSAVVRGAGERGWLVVEITKDHIERIRREPMLFLERMVVLGVALPGVESDILQELSVETRPMRTS